MPELVLLLGVGDSNSLGVGGRLGAAQLNLGLPAARAKVYQP